MPANRVPLSNPTADLAHLRDHLIAAITRVIDSGPYILGPELAAFERELQERLGVAGAVGVGSGTEALVLALLAIGIEPGDEVITVSHTAGPTVAAIRMIGAIPVLVDVERETYGLDPARLEAAAGLRARAIVVVHLYGHPARLDDICEFGKLRGIPSLRIVLRRKKQRLADVPLDPSVMLAASASIQPRTLRPLATRVLLSRKMMNG
jgi:dTDP-4-amino-4,6-dideoxygalactose transaminase